MKELIDDLEASGYVVRRPDPRDRRAKLIFTTDRGERTIVRCRALIAEIEADWERVIGKRRMREVKTALRAILAFEAGRGEDGEPARSGPPPARGERRACRGHRHP